MDENDKEDMVQASKLRKRERTEKEERGKGKGKTVEKPTNMEDVVGFYTRT